MVRAGLRSERNVPEHSPEAGRPAAPGWGQLINIEKVLAAATNCLGLCRSWCAVASPQPELPGATCYSRRRAVTLEK